MLKRGIQFIRNQNQLKNLTIYGLGQFFNLVTPLLVAPHVISVCGIEGYGKAAFSMALFFFLIVFIDYGSDINGVKEVSLNRDNNKELQRIFISTYLAKFILLILVISFTSLFFYTIPFFSKDKFLYLFSIPILIGQFFNPTWFLQGVENFKQITVINILSKIIYLIAIFTFISSEGDYVFINLWWGIGMIFANGLSFLFILFRNSFNFRNVKNEDVIFHLKSGFSIFSSQIFMSLQMYAPIIMIGFFGNDILAGMYRVVDQVVVIFKTYILLFFNFVFSRVCYLIAKNKGQGMRYWLVFNGSNFIFITISMILVYYFSTEIILYFKPFDTNNLENILQVAVFIPLLMAVSVPFKQLVLAFGYQKKYVQTTMVVVIFTLLSILFVLPYFGIVGVIAVLIIAELLSIFIFSFVLKKKIFIIQIKKQSYF
ncbi:MAG TPA: oligosaccharide flippase family protein [Flavobacterium sp.]|nr:oligosaccharide flippase family protein [Flavobacterium sp.]HRZ32297.1 oligosaccharide flippase family protein [Flavobacterium sp.]